MSSPIAKTILIDELTDNTHIESVEDVIFWALEQYVNKPTLEPKRGQMVAYCIIQRIKDEEAKLSTNN